MIIQAILEQFKESVPQELARLLAQSVPESKLKGDLTVWLRSYDREHPEGDVALEPLARKVALEIAMNNVEQAAKLRYPNRTIQFQGALTPGAFEKGYYIPLSESSTCTLYASGPQFRNETIRLACVAALKESQPQKTTAQHESWLTLQEVIANRDLKQVDRREFFTEKRRKRLSVLSLEDCQDEKMAAFWGLFAGLTEHEAGKARLPEGIEPIEDIAKAFEELNNQLTNETQPEESDLLGQFRKSKLDVLVATFREAYETQLKPYIGTSEQNTKIQEFLKNRPFTRSGFGYTALPTYPVNQFCASLAAMTIPAGCANPREKFWKTLYPDLQRTAYAEHDNQWPNYGEALLSRELTGQLLNYRLVTKMLQSAEVAKLLKNIEIKEHEDEIIVKCVQRGVSKNILSGDDLLVMSRFEESKAPKDVWEKLEKLSRPKKYNNFLEYFTELAEVFNNNMAYRPGAAHKRDDVGAAGHEEVAEFLEVMTTPEYSFLMQQLDRIKSILGKAQQEEVTLGNIEYLQSLKLVLAENVKADDLRTCFGYNAGKLKKALQDETIKTLLSGQVVSQYTLWLIRGLVQGRDPLLLPEVSSIVYEPELSNAVQKVSAIASCIDEGDNDFVESIAKRLRACWDAGVAAGNENYNLKNLFNLLYEISTANKQVLFLRSFLDDNFRIPKEYLKEINDYIFALKIAKQMSGVRSEYDVIFSLKKYLNENNKGLIDKLSYAQLADIIKETIVNPAVTTEIILLISKHRKLRYSEVATIIDILPDTDWRLASRIMKAVGIIKKPEGYYQKSDYSDLDRGRILIEPVSLKEIAETLILLNYIFYNGPKSSKLSKTYSRLKEKMLDEGHSSEDLLGMFNYARTEERKMSSSINPQVGVQFFVASLLAEKLGREVSSLESLFLAVRQIPKIPGYQILPVISDEIRNSLIKEINESNSYANYVNELNEEDSFYFEYRVLYVLITLMPIAQLYITKNNEEKEFIYNILSAIHLKKRPELIRHISYILSCQEKEEEARILQAMFKNSSRGKLSEIDDKNIMDINYLIKHSHSAAILRITHLLKDMIFTEHTKEIHIYKYVKHASDKVNPEGDQFGLAYIANLKGEIKQRCPNLFKEFIQFSNLLSGVDFSPRVSEIMAVKDFTKLKEKNEKNFKAFLSAYRTELTDSINPNDQSQLDKLVLRFMPYLDHQFWILFFEKHPSLFSKSSYVNKVYENMPSSDKPHIFTFFCENVPEFLQQRLNIITQGTTPFFEFVEALQASRATTEAVRMAILSLNPVQQNEVHSYYLSCSAEDKLAYLLEHCDQQTAIILYNKIIHLIYFSLKIKNGKDSFSVLNLFRKLSNEKQMMFLEVESWCGLLVNDKKLNSDDSYIYNLIEAAPEKYVKTFAKLMALRQVPATSLSNALRHKKEPVYQDRALSLLINAHKVAAKKMQEGTISINDYINIYNKLKLSLITLFSDDKIDNGFRCKELLDLLVEMPAEQVADFAMSLEAESSCPVYYINTIRYITCKLLSVEPKKGEAFYAAFSDRVKNVRGEDYTDEELSQQIPGIDIYLSSQLVEPYLGAPKHLEVHDNELPYYYQHYAKYNAHYLSKNFFLRSKLRGYFPEGRLQKISIAAYNFLKNTILEMVTDSSVYLQTKTLREDVVTFQEDLNGCARQFERMLDLYLSEAWLNPRNRARYEPVMAVIAKSKNAAPETDRFTEAYFGKLFSEIENRELPTLKAIWKLAIQQDYNKRVTGFYELCFRDKPFAVSTATGQRITRAYTLHQNLSAIAEDLTKAQPDALLERAKNACRP